MRLLARLALIALGALVGLGLASILLLFMLSPSTEDCRSDQAIACGMALMAMAAIGLPLGAVAGGFLGNLVHLRLQRR